MRYRNAGRYSNVMNPMSANAATNVAPTPSPDARQWRAVGWIAVTLVLFVLLLIGASWAASRLTSDLGIANQLYLPG